MNKSEGMELLKQFNLYLFLYLQNIIYYKLKKMKILNTGDILSLSQNSQINNNIEIGLIYHENKNIINNELDIEACVMLLKNGIVDLTEEQFIFYNCLKNKDNSVSLELGWEDENTFYNDSINLNLSNISADIDEIVIAVCNHNDNSDFVNLSGIDITINNKLDSSNIGKYQILDSFPNCNNLVIGKITRFQNEWHFRALSNATTGGIKELLSIFGCDFDF